MKQEEITEEDLISIYNICKKRLTISLEDFLNNPKCEKIRKITIRRYDSLNNFISSIINTKSFDIFKENVMVEFGKDNFTDENIYAYFVDRINELDEIYGEIELNYLYTYCLKDKKFRSIEIRNRKLIKKDEKRIKLNGLYDYLLKDTDINKKRFLNLNDEYFEFERTLLLTIDSNIDGLKNLISKLDDDVKEKFINAIKSKYHLVEVNGYYVCKYLFDNFRMVKLLKDTVGYKRLNSDNFMDIFKCSLNVNNVTLAFKYVIRDDSKIIKDTYLELKDNESFKILVNMLKDNLGIKFSIIKILGKNLEEVNDLNKYLGFMNKITLSKYILMTEEVKKKYLREALLLYKKKILRGTKIGCIEFLNRIPMFCNLKKEDKDILLNNYKTFIEEIFNLSYDVCFDLEFKLVDDLILYVSNKVIEIAIMEAKGETLETNRLEFIKNTYKNDFDKTSLIYNNLDSDKYIVENVSKDEKDRDARIRDWKEQLLLQYKLKHNDNSYEFFGAVYDLLALYERKTGKKYDPKYCLFSFHDVYSYYLMSDEEKRIFEDELIIEENFK